LSIYESELVPGLFQTADYARTIIAGHQPRLDQAEVERRVALRMARRSLLTRAVAPPTLCVMLNESILHRPVGGRRIMLEQLHRLAESCDLPNVSLRIVPFAIGFHHGVDSGPFTILRFPRTGDGKDTEPPVVYVEGITGALYLDRPHEVERYGAVVRDILRAVDDTDGAASRALLRAAIRGLS
jgi:hypothetical protein